MDEDEARYVEENEAEPGGEQLNPSDVVISATSGDVEKQIGSDGNPETKKRKKNRRGRCKRRKWRPYNKLSWKEKGELEDRQAKRATRIRAERFAHGQPVAPYNTTQFLMEDQNVQEPDLEMIASHRHHRESTSLESSDEFYSSPEDEEEFLQKEFSEVYERIHAERLNSMSKSELVQEYIQLEDRVDKLEQKLKEVISDERKAKLAWEMDSESCQKIRIFEEEIRKLTQVNESLKLQNKQLCVQEEKSAADV